MEGKKIKKIEPQTWCAFVSPYVLPYVTQSSCYVHQIHMNLAPTNLSDP